MALPLTYLFRLVIPTASNLGVFLPLMFYSQQIFTTWAVISKQVLVLPGPTP